MSETSIYRIRSTVLRRLLIEVAVKSNVSLTYVQHECSEYRIHFSDEDRLRGARNEDGRLRYSRPLAAGDTSRGLSLSRQESIAETLLSSSLHA